MAIQSGDIKFIKSQVMDDVPEGGGAPTANVIPDGADNAVFPDVTEVDRAGGKLKVRKAFLAVRTDDAEHYMDANIIIERPPNDPNVSIALMTTGDTFDRRTDIMTRVQAYFAPGTSYAGWLFGNHLAGQMTVAVAQRVGSDLPILGKTLVLRKLEGQPAQAEQFVRVRTVASEVRTFSDGPNQTYELLIVSMGIDAPLAVDFTGFDPARIDPSITAQQQRTVVREATVADAARYYGVTPMTSAADIGDFSVQVQSIYTQLVPSAQIEAPIADARTNQVTAGFVPAGGVVVQTLTLGFTTAQAMFVGAAAVPGSVRIERAGITLTDAGGKLFNGAAEVGAYDYENGIAVLATNVWGATGGTHTVTYTPAAVPSAVTQSLGIPVTAENRSLTQVVPLPRAPARASLNVAYTVAGRWYVLREDGTGAIRGTDPSHGVGSLHYSTGTVSVTFGALPDIGAVIYQWVDEAATSPYAPAALHNNGQAYIAINSDGVQTTERGGAAFKAGSITIQWQDGPTLRTMTDNGLGQLQGYGTGTMDATRGVIKLSPTTLPPHGTLLTVASSQSNTGTFAHPVTWSGAGVFTANLGGAVEPGSFSMPVSFYVPINSYMDQGFTVRSDDKNARGTIRDSGTGELILTAGGIDIMVGAIDYATGVLSITPTSTPATDATATLVTLATLTRSMFYLAPPVSGGSGGSGNESVGWFWSMRGYIGETGLGVYYAFAGHVGIGSLPSFAYYSVTPAGPVAPITVELTELRISTDVGAAFQLRNAAFDLGGRHHTQLPDGQLVSEISPTTGVGTQVGTVTPGTGEIVIASWEAGAASTVTNWRGAQVPPSEGPSSPYAASTVTFRTAAAPLRPSSLSVVGEMLDGTDFAVTVDVNGKINGTRVKGRVSLDVGVVELYFVNPGNTDPDAPTIDLSFLGIAGVGVLPMDLAHTPTLRYNAVAYSFIPLEASVIGVDPVRLPTDGRVPIVRPGMFGVVGHTGTINPGTLIDGMVIDCGRDRLSRARLLDATGAVIHEGYTVDLEAGKLTVVDKADMVQPVVLEHRIEDMALIADAQLSGYVRFTRPLTHAFPAGSYLSTALYLGTLYARVSVLFDQATWTNAWADAPIGSGALASYNDIASPIVVTNRGALTERWACIFQSGGTLFQLIGEHVGILGTFSKNEICAPHNAAAGTPYLTLNPLGWGDGWPAGAVLRFNTVGATTPFDLLQTIQQGPEAGLDYEFRLLARGDVDRT